jgi:hypothetical protein
MKNLKLYGILLLMSIGFTVFYTSCTRVEPNYEGVLMTNFGKNGKSDFSLQKGYVGTMAPGSKLYQVPLWEQRASFEKTLHLKAADNTEVSCNPQYSIRIIEKRAVDVVFDNKQLDEKNFMQSFEDNILEMKIYDIMKEESRKWVTDSLMANGGSLRFEEDVTKRVKEAFNGKGVELLSLTCQLDYSDAVKERINERNKVQQNISVLDQQIIEQQKKNELAKLKAQENQTLSSGLTPQVLTQQMIDKWDGRSSFYGSNPISFVRNIAQ